MTTNASRNREAFAIQQHDLFYTGIASSMNANPQGGSFNTSPTPTILPDINSTHIKSAYLFVWVENKGITSLAAEPLVYMPTLSTVAI